jgi:hypothetical protein
MSPISTHSQIDITEIQKHAPKQYLSWNPPSFAIHLVTPYISIYFKFFSHRSSELGSWTGNRPNPAHKTDIRPRMSALYPFLTCFEVSDDDVVISVKRTTSGIVAVGG